MKLLYWIVVLIIEMEQLIKGTYDKKSWLFRTWYIAVRYFNNYWCTRKVDFQIMWNVG